MAVGNATFMRVIDIASARLLCNFISACPSIHAMCDGTVFQGSNGFASLVMGEGRFVGFIHTGFLGGLGFRHFSLLCA